MIDIDERYYARDQKMRQFVDDEVGYTIPQLPKWIELDVMWPFGGAYARVYFYDANNNDNYISSYLDVTDELGYMQKPYFEIYPDKDGDCTRFLMDEQDKMYAEIVRTLASRRKKWWQIWKR